MSFSLVPMLLAGISISREIKRALRENRLHDAGRMLMTSYGLSCAEVRYLLDFPLC